MQKWSNAENIKQMLNNFKKFKEETLCAQNVWQQILPSFRINTRRQYPFILYFSCPTRLSSISASQEPEI